MFTNSYCMPILARLHNISSYSESNEWQFFLDLISGRTEAVLEFSATFGRETGAQKEWKEGRKKGMKERKMTNTLNGSKVDEEVMHSWSP